MGFLWLLGYSQVDCGLGDHFATTVAHLPLSCALSVAIVCQMFMPPYIIIMPYLRHYSRFVPKNRLRLIIRAIGRDKTIVYFAIKRRLNQAESVDYQRLPLE